MIKVLLDNGEVHEFPTGKHWTRWPDGLSIYADDKRMELLAAFHNDKWVYVRRD